MRIVYCTTLLYLCFALLKQKKYTGIVSPREEWRVTHSIFAHFLCKVLRLQLSNSSLFNFWCHFFRVWSLGIFGFIFDVRVSPHACTKSKPSQFYASIWLNQGVSKYRHYLYVTICSLSHIHFLFSTYKKRDMVKDNKEGNKCHHSKSK